MIRFPRVALAVLVAVTTGACVADETSSPTASPSATASNSPTPTASTSASASSPPTPAVTPEPSLSIALPDTTDPRVVSATIAADVGEAGGTLTVTVTSASTERIDELVLRWPAELNATLLIAPFTPSEDRIRDGGDPLVQPWTKWVMGPGEQGEPAGTISVGWGPLLPEAQLIIELAVTRRIAGPVAFDLQLLSGNDLLTFDGGEPAEVRVEVP
jgi:hypothetical protein